MIAHGQLEPIRRTRPLDFRGPLDATRTPQAKRASRARRRYRKATR